MPDLLDRIYCSEQIHIPPTFPYIMKLYCKAAIRTQPYDLLKWSAAYFRALANGEEPPVKERVEYPPYDSPSGLTPGYIKILINQFGKDPTTGVTAQTLFKKWSDICMEEQLLIKLIALLGATTTVNWVRFVAVCAGFISKNLTQTMTLICELFTEEPEGGMATMPCDLFIDLYIFLAEMECGPLTEEEKTALEAIMDEEDVCDVADKIKQGLYEGEELGEVAYGEAAGEMPEPEEVEEEEQKVTEEQESLKEFGEASVAEDEENKETQEEVEGKEQPEQKEEEETEREAKEQEEKQEEDKGGVFDDGSMKEEESKSAISVEGEAAAGEEEKSDEGKQQQDEVEEPQEPMEEQKPPKKRISLEDLEESIRKKIQEKLDQEEESLLEEEDREEREFEELSSYLLGAAARVHKFTAESLGFRIFKKYMRQEVPGIGPFIEGDQVNSVVEFIQYWSDKQELLVMPRNIRHWMCPPLDKVPTPQP